MIKKSENSYILKLTCISLFLALFSLLSIDLQAQKSRTNSTNSFNESTSAQQPIYRDYKGVQIGMTAEEVRTKLGQAAQQLEDQDFYVVSATETAQIFYDTARKVKAISIDYVGAHTGAPTFKEVMGTDMQPNPDGSMYKMVRYDQLGFWVSYNRTAGEPAVVTVTIQRYR